MLRLQPVKNLIIRCNRYIPPVKIQFLDAAYSIDLKIPVSAELYEKFKNDESLKKFLDETVRNALAFAERSFIPSPD